MNTISATKEEKPPLGFTTLFNKTFIKQHGFLPEYSGFLLRKGVVFILLR